MKTSINKVFQVDHPIDLVWEYLADPEKIVTCVPGASLTEKLGDRRYKGKISMKFGPVKAAYDGEITIEDLNLADRKMVLKGAGVDPKGKGSADMEMIGILSEKDGGTEVNFNMEVTLIGMLAQFGARLVNDVADQVLNQFVVSFKNKLDAEGQARPGREAVVSHTEASIGVSETTIPVKETEAAIPAPEPAPAAPAIKNDASDLNAIALLWAVLRGFFSRLFGGGK